MNKKTISEIYDEHDRNPNYLDNAASFMVENPQQALRKHDREYLKKVRKEFLNLMVFHTCIFFVVYGVLSGPDSNPESSGNITSK